MSVNFENIPLTFKKTVLIYKKYACLFSNQSSVSDILLLVWLELRKKIIIKLKLKM